MFYERVFLRLFFDKIDIGTAIDILNVRYGGPSFCNNDGHNKRTKYLSNTRICATQIYDKKKKVKIYICSNSI